MKITHGHFKDNVSYDSGNKTAVSVRDGFLEYMGSEIGQEPSDKMFKVYRSPATIANVANLMQGIPLTDEHVDLDSPVNDSVGSVQKAVMIDLDNPETSSKLAIQNIIDINDKTSDILATGKRELSLGYTANLVDFDGNDYDFEQRDIEPHHLAIVNQGRCGSVCSFIDKKIKGLNMNNKFKDLFYDAAGMPNIKEIIEMVEGLREAVGTMPLDEVKKLVPILQKVNERMGGGKTEEVEPATDEEAEPMEKEAEVEDAKKDVETEDSKEEVEDKKDYKDSSDFKDAVAKAVDSKIKEYAVVVEKARNFVDADYSFKDKSSEQVMRDALATEHGSQAFSDSELEVAFKLLKPSQSNYANFGDKANSDYLNKLKNKQY